MDFVREQHKDVTLFIAQPGERDGRDDVGELKTLLTNAVAAGDRKFVVDIGHMTILESRGIGTLVGSHRLAVMKEGALIVTGVRPQIFKLLEVVKLSRAILIRSDRQEAIAALQKGPVKPDTIEKLLAGNPQQDKVDAWWKEKGEAAYRVAAPTPGGEHRLSREATPQISTPDVRKLTTPLGLPTPVTTAQPVKVNADWQEALSLFNGTAALCKRHGIPFVVETRFGEVFLKLAEKLAQIDTDPREGKA